jgi:hypothetical protein
MTTTEIERRIAEIESTERALVGSDEGTHGKPQTYRVYEEITGERYAVRSFAGANGSRCSELEAREDTEGRLIHFPESQRGMREKQAELKRLWKELREVATAR